LWFSHFSPSVFPACDAGGVGSMAR
jgi:hypothetical protein